MVQEWIAYFYITHPVLYRTILLIGATKCIITTLNFLYWLVWSLYIFYCSPPPDITSRGEWGVVTGCTDGIGKGYTEMLASQGMNIVLMSRSLDKLDAQSIYLKEKYKINTLVIQIDFSNASREMYRSVSLKLAQLDIGVLVNNVGKSVEYPHFFCDESNKLEDIEIMLNVCCSSFLKMTHMILPGMLERKRGVVINISSGAGLQPIPLLNIYSASKAFMKMTSLAWYREYGSSNLLIQTVTPFLVTTKLSRVRKSRLFIPNVNEFIQHSMRTIGEYSITTGYFSHEIIAGIRETVPVFIDQWFFFNTVMKRLKYGKRKQFI